MPAKVVFLTDGPTRTVRIGATTIQIRRTTPKNMETAGRLSGMVIQAFRELGKAHVTPERIAHLKRTIPAAKRRELLAEFFVDLSPSCARRGRRNLRLFARGFAHASFLPASLGTSKYVSQDWQNHAPGFGPLATILNFRHVAASRIVSPKGPAGGRTEFLASP